MIQDFVKAWDENKNLLQKEFEITSPSSYQDIVEKLVKIVINPYLEKIGNYPDSLDIKNMTVIDNGDYQGTTLYVIPYYTYQPSVDDYVYTHNYYGSCSGCDTFEAIECEWNIGWNGADKEDKIGAAEDFMTLALHILQRFKGLKED